MEDYVREYFRNKMYKVDGGRYTVLCIVESAKLKLMTCRENIWKEAEPLEKEHEGTLKWLEETFQKKDDVLAKVRNEQQGLMMLKESITGFIGVNKSSLESNGYGFKLKNLLQTRNALGASCEQASREITIQRFMDVKQLMGKSEDTYIQNGDNMHIEYENKEIRITKNHLCLIYEMFMRMIESPGWFLNPEEAVYTDIVHLTISTNKLKEKYVFDYQEMRVKTGVAAKLK
jgi:hypothetical protein